MNPFKFCVYNVSDGLHSDAKELLSHLLVIDTDKRFTIEEISPSDFAYSDIDMPVTPVRRVIAIDSVLTTLTTREASSRGLERREIIYKTNTRAHLLPQQPCHDAAQINPRL